MKTYAVIYSWAGSNYSAHAPDVPGCIATGKTLDDAKQIFREALEFHLEGLRLEGYPIPEPSTHVDVVTVSED